MYVPPRSPRTHHLVGSRLAAGASEAGQVSVRSLSTGTLVFEEKLDGSEVGIFFDGGRPFIRNRGELLTGGPRERQFDPLKAWLAVNEAWLFEVLGDRLVLLAEWCFAHHTAFYDRLSTFLFEFDLLDRQSGRYLSTAARRKILDGLPIMSVPVVHQGNPGRDEFVPRLMKPSLFKSPDWEKALAKAATRQGVDPDQALARADRSAMPEGFYVKHEVDDFVVGRYKWIRHDFFRSIIESGSHWSQRVLIENELAPGVDFYAEPATAAARMRS